jgi:hypothetical protein
MANVLDIIKEFAAKAGIRDNQEFDLALAGSAAETLKGLELPDSVIDVMRTNLMDIGQAKANLDLKNHFTGQAFNGLESSFWDQLKASGFEDGEIEEIKGASKSTGQRISKALEKYQAKMEDAKKHKPGSDEYVRKIAEAQKALEDTRSQYESKLTETQKAANEKLQKLWMQNKLAGIQWNDAIPPIAREAAYNAGQLASLSKLDAKIIWDDELKPLVVQAKDETLPLVLNGKQFGYDDLHSVILQEHKLMKESGGGTPDNSRTPNYTAPVHGGGSNQPKQHPLIANALANLNIPSMD